VHVHEGKCAHLLAIKYILVNIQYSMKCSLLLMRCVQLKLVCGTTVAKFDLVSTLPDTYV